MCRIPPGSRYVGRVDDVTALVIADADSYLKWGVARAAEWREAGVDVEVVVVMGAVTPSPDQALAAVDDSGFTIEWLSLADVTARVQAGGYDVILAACRGPMVGVLEREVVDRANPRPVLMSGLPGVWMPPNARGIRHRRGADAIIVHSRREREAVSKLVPAGRLRHVGLASLATRPTAVAGSFHDHVVFAPQALVPRTRAQREALFSAVVDAATAHPDVTVVVKTRGLLGEAQTHTEAFGFADYVRAGRVNLPANVVIATGPLSAYLARARGLVTVSSTAALEAVAADVAVLCIADFGIDDGNINTVFEGSGLLGTLSDLRELVFFEADGQWRRDNYFHGRDADDWIAVGQKALDERASGSAPVARRRRRDIRGAWGASVIGPSRLARPMCGGVASSRGRSGWRGGRCDDCESRGDAHATYGTVAYACVG